MHQVPARPMDAVDCHDGRPRIVEPCYITGVRSDTGKRDVEIEGRRRGLSLSPPLRPIFQGYLFKFNALLSTLERGKYCLPKLWYLIVEYDAGGFYRVGGLKLEPRFDLERSRTRSDVNGALGGGGGTHFREI